MQKITEKYLCSGCGTCYSACPVQCISMCEDSEGFLYPHIDEKKCVGCGKCQRICPALKDIKGHPKGRAYACISKNDDMRMRSSSGGIFTLIAEYIIRLGGVVFGAAYDNELNVHHILVSSTEELYKLRGSKYLQSRIEDTYKTAENYLKNGNYVLFTGTPCQISGLKAYLVKDYERLITQDIICHGVPTPKIWQKYLKHRVITADAEIDALNPPLFRNKDTGWESFSVMVNFKKNKKYLQIASKDLYMRAFLKNLCLRPSCYNCNFKSLERESDITLADFWGVNTVCSDMSDNKGTSLVLINSAAGENIFKNISDKMIYKPVSIDEAVKYNPAACRACDFNKKRNAFMEEVTAENFDVIVKKYTKEISLKKYIFRAVKKVIRLIK